MSEQDEAGYKQFLEDKVAEQEAEIAGLKAQIAELKKQRGISSAREGLTFNDHTGIWSDKEGNYFCPSCLNDEKRNPLKTEERGWRCTAAGHYFGNPNAPRPVVRRGGSWMSS